VAMVYFFCRHKSSAVSFHELVPHDGNTAQSGDTVKGR
jgi:hypothetical protein